VPEVLDLLPDSPRQQNSEVVRCRPAIQCLSGALDGEQRQVSPVVDGTLSASVPTPRHGPGTRLANHSVRNHGVQPGGVLLWT
jgi:hypothetical protein